MNYIEHLLASTALLLTFTSLSSPANAALVRYTYTGNPFNSFSTTGESAPYNVDPSRLSRVSIDFTIEDSLVPKNDSFESEIDLTKNDSSPFRSFSISDGYTTIDHSQIDPYRSIKFISITFDTDSEGNVDGRWYITGKSGYYTFYDTAYSSIESTSNASPGPNHDGVTYTSEYYGFPPGSEYIIRSLSAVDTTAPGTWTRSLIPVSNVPLPGGMLLLMSALCSLCFNRRYGPKNVRLTNHLAVRL